MSLKFGLNIKSKLPNNRPPPPKRKAIFDEEDEEDAGGASKASDNAEEIGEFDFAETTKGAENDSKQKLSSKSKGKPPGLSGLPPLKPKAKPGDPSVEFATTSTVKASALDPSLNDYDAAYDAIHAKRAAKQAAEQADAAERRPKYMEKLFESAEVRKRDQLRARDKVLQREREAEGDEFADKEKFVTGAYKQQQEEVKRLEEEEKKRQEEEDRKRGKLGMQGFYRKMMEDDEKRHQEAVEAAAEVAKGGMKLQTEDPKEKTDADIAKELNQKGQNIILTEEGQVADKRQLLSAGLNVVAKPKSAATAATASSRSSAAQPAYRRGDTQKAVRERQSKMIAEQLEQAAKRTADEEAEERRKLEHTAKSRKTETDISSARERYLQRKREAAAAKGS
jgi:hypothetical protein